MVLLNLVEKRLIIIFTLVLVEKRPIIIFTLVLKTNLKNGSFSPQNGPPNGTMA